ncbi:putative high affinity methionine permease [Ophiocordyceps camponoti-floridani]|uniref:Putative high affinity methionine permease n=1 Tax=Ophiocordyceps camponoti-floridani TaxID=2030778 RepID=A0A8H4Q6N6_9HYPO|nr:putative high affinity methionine permease [Ophiocordyceps camponoti-floridani]
MSDPKPGAAADGTWQDKVLSATTSDHVQLSDSLLETDLQTYALPEDRKIGVWGAVFFIFNKVIGTGIFSTPSIVFAATGSVGMSIILWLVGAIIALCGMSVFLEFGLAIPISGGTKNYVERVYRRPRYLASCFVAAHAVLLGFSSANSLSFGRYVLRATSGNGDDGWQARAIAIGVVSFAVALHSVFPKWGIKLLNVLGISKILVLVFIVCTGFAALAGHRRVPNPHNFDEAFSSVDGGGAYEYSKALLMVIYSYSGWEGATYVMGELKRPGKTLAVAAPIAIGSVAVLYVLANVAYFAAIPREQMQRSEVLVADFFFRCMFGNSAAVHVLPLLVALSNLGNILAGSFATSRITQEMAKEGLLPFSRFWASNKPLNAPAASLLLHWIITVIVLVAPPQGPAYTLIINISSYAQAWINTLVVAGLLWLHYKKSEKWTSPWHTHLSIAAVFLAANLFLIGVPFLPPRGGQKEGEYPYYLYPIVGLCTFGLAAAYWVLWRKVIPYFSGHKLESERTFDENGVEVVRYRQVAVARRR